MRIKNYFTADDGYWGMISLRSQSAVAAVFLSGRIEAPAWPGWSKLFSFLTMETPRVKWQKMNQRPMYITRNKIIMPYSSHLQPLVLSTALTTLRSKVNMAVFSSAAPKIPSVHNPLTHRLRTEIEVFCHAIDLKKLLQHTSQFAITNPVLNDTLQKSKKPLDSSKSHQTMVPSS